MLAGAASMFYRNKFVESAQGTVVNTVGPPLYDATLEAFTITAGAQIAVNGVVDDITSGVVLLLYWNHSVYQKNNAGDFYYKTISTNAWTGPVTDPRIGETAVRIADFRNTMAINTHLNWLDSPSYATSANVTDYGKVETALNYIGINIIRDTLGNPYQVPIMQRMGTDGYKLNLMISGYSDASETLTQEVADVVTLKNYMVSVEGNNEIENGIAPYKGLTGFAAARAFQTDTYNAVKANSNISSLPVIQLSFGDQASFNTFGDLSAAADQGNTHTYLWDYGQILITQIPSRSTDALKVTPGKPIAATESGWSTAINDTSGYGVDEATQAKLILTFYFDQFRAGIVRTYIYELFNDYVDTNHSNIQNCFGIFQADGVTAKPAATALHNLTSILNDASANAKTFTLNSLSFTITSLPTSGDHLLLERSDGTFYLVVWNEAIVWSFNGHAPVTTSPVAITVAFPSRVYSRIITYNPIASLNAVNTYNNVSAPISLSLQADQPIIIQIDPT